MLFQCLLFVLAQATELKHLLEFLADTLEPDSEYQ